MIFLGLDARGFLLALFFGFLLYIYGGLPHLLLMLSFLFLSLYITSINYKEKAAIGVYDYQRGWQNVLSNGLIPVAFALLSSKIGLYPFIASVAAITADKFASELGILGGKPVELFTWKKVKPGKSGAISGFGTFAALVGALSISFISIFLFGTSTRASILLGIAGFLGNIADSIAGFFEERGLGTKETSNIVCGLVGGLLGWSLKFLISG